MSIGHRVYILQVDLVGLLKDHAVAVLDSATTRRASTRRPGRTPLFRTQPENADSDSTSDFYGCFRHVSSPKPDCPYCHEVGAFPEDSTVVEGKPYLRPCPTCNKVMITSSILDECANCSNKRYAAMILPPPPAPATTQPVGADKPFHTHVRNGFHRPRQSQTRSCRY